MKSWVFEKTKNKPFDNLDILNNSLPLLQYFGNNEEIIDDGNRQQKRWTYANRF